jgi:hypothetical protein
MATSFNIVAHVYNPNCSQRVVPAFQSLSSRRASPILPCATQFLCNNRRNDLGLSLGWSLLPCTAGLTSRTRATLNETDPGVVSLKALLDVAEKAAAAGKAVCQVISWYNIHSV